MTKKGKCDVTVYIHLNTQQHTHCLHVGVAKSMAHRVSHNAEESAHEQNAEL